MATIEKSRKKRISYEFAGFLFVLTVAGIIISAFLYKENVTLTDKNKLLNDSLSVFSNTFIQGELNAIYNDNNFPWKIEQMQVTFLNSKSGKIENLDFELDDVINPKSKFQLDRAKFQPWNGSCLYYSFRIEGSYQTSNSKVIKTRLLSGDYATNVKEKTLIIKSITTE